MPRKLILLQTDLHQRFSHWFCISLRSAGGNCILLCRLSFFIFSSQENLITHPFCFVAEGKTHFGSMKSVCIQFTPLTSFKNLDLEQWGWWYIHAITLFLHLKSFTSYNYLDLCIKDIIFPLDSQQTWHIVLPAALHVRICNKASLLPVQPIPPHLVTLNLYVLDDFWSDI